jgi:adenosine deaminase CECR1
MIQEKQHLMGILSDEANRYPSDSTIRWDLMNTIWGRGSTQLIANIKIKKQYITALYDTALDEGVQYLETRKNFGPSEMLYELSLDPEYNATYGKKYLDTTGDLDIQLTINTTKEFISEHPEFIGHRRIMYSTRYSNLSQILDDMNRAVVFYNQYPDHFRGFDLVAEEDAGRSHLYFMDDFLQLYDSATQQSKIPLYLHTGETSWPEDLITSNFPDDMVATAQNTYDAIVLGAFRVGHGLAYINYPFLLDELHTRGVAVEVCPVSNQILGLQADLRNHPAQSYLRMGIPLVLGADDPGSFGYDHFTTDWYEAFMGWGLSLRQLKKLSQNTITYSTMDASEKQEAFAKWTPYWNAYIANITAEACNADLDTSPEFQHIIPRDGALTGSTQVHIFGRNFQSAVCSTIRCKFGDIESGSTYYISMSHLICSSPPGSGSEQLVNVSISLDNGATYLETGKTFTYKYPAMTIPPDEPNDINGVTSSSSKQFIMLHCIVILILQICFTSRA